MTTRCSLHQGKAVSDGISDVENKAYMSVPSPIQGLTLAIGGVNIISCLAEKLNRFRNFANGDLPKDNNNNEGKSKNKSLFSLALNIFTDLKGKISRIQVLPPAPSLTTFDGRKEKKSTEEIYVNDTTERSDDQLIDGRCKHECVHLHHVHSATWKHAMLVHYSHVPVKLQEPYIEHGYMMPFMPWSYYLKAMYTPSYELMNIWTHLIPSVYFFFLFISFTQEFDYRNAWPLFTITLCASILMAFSALAHLFHSKSSLHHCCWFMFDYFGITIYAFATTICNFYSGALLKYYRLLSGHYLNISIIVCSFGFFCLCITQTGTRWASVKLSRRMKVFVNGAGYFYGALPIFQRIYESGREEPALWYHTMAMILFVAAPVIYGSDFPQKRWPGRFNVFGHSHQLFHILTAFAAYFDAWAIYYDITEGPWNVIHQEDDYPMLEDVAKYYAALVAFSITFAFIIHRVIKDDYANEKPLLKGEVRCTCGLPEAKKYQCKT